MDTTKEKMYFTIKNPTDEIVIKEKSSKFISFACSVFDENEVKNKLVLIRKKHPRANHICYAYQLGYQTPRYRVSDDGEPNNSAGIPIYGQLQSFGVTNVLVVVVRYFGGIKLGVGGLVSAYKTAAKSVLEIAELIPCTENITIHVHFEYGDHNKLLALLKEYNALILEQKMERTGQYTIQLAKSATNHFLGKGKRLSTCTFDCIY